ncbi:MAG: RNA polymerase sigma factor SigZ [Chloroflexota bacterium]|nr:RNA polymerase sigma factor SigZ [Chloroflexota bacterium]
MSISTESVWQAFHEPLEQFIRRQARDKSAAEDILQDIFVKIHTHIDSLKDESKLQGWLYRIARNAIYDYYRSQRPVVELSETLDLLEELPEDDMERELLPCLAAMVQRLPVDYRQALILTEYEGLTQKELAERLGLSFSGAKSRVQCARETEDDAARLLPL